MGAHATCKEQEANKEVSGVRFQGSGKVTAVLKPDPWNLKPLSISFTQQWERAGHAEAARDWRDRLEVARG